MKTNPWRFGMILFLAVFVLATVTRGTYAQQVHHYSLGTASTSGTWYILGAGFSAHINKLARNIKVTPGITAGSDENYNLIKRGKMDFAMIHPDFAPTDIKNGVLKRGAGLPFRQFLWSSALNDFHWVVRKDSPIKTFADIKGKRIAVGPQGSGGTVKNLRILQTLTGYEPDKNYRAMYLTYGGMINALQDNTVDMAAFFAAYPIASLVSTMLKSDMRLLPVTEAEMAKVLKDESSLMLVSSTIPANTYKGQTSAVPIFGQNQGILVRADLPEEDVYQIFKAFFTNVEQRNAVHPQAKGWNIEATVALGAREAEAGIPFHPGVIRYLKEVGKWTPALEVK